MKNIYVIGSSNTDMVVQCERLPAPGETLLGGRFVQAQGGKGANQAVAAARLGGNVTFFCRVGKDNLGEASLRAFREEGIHTDCIIWDEHEPSGVALIAVDRQGENFIVVAPGANGAMQPDDLEPLAERLQPGDVILLQLEIPLPVVERAAQLGRERDARVILDPAPAPAAGLSPELYPQVDYLLPNEHEAALLVGGANSFAEMAEEFRKRGVRNALLTLGRQGCLLASAQGARTYAGYPVEAVDSTAAGDAFAGGIAVALAEGKIQDEAIAWAQAAAALSVTRLGAQPSLPRRAEVESFLQKQNR